MKSGKLQWSRKSKFGFVLVACSALLFTLGMTGVIGKEWAEPTTWIVTSLLFTTLVIGMVLSLKVEK